MTVADRIVAAVWAERWRLVAMLVPLVAAAAVAALRVGVDNAVHVWFVEGDPALQEYEAFHRQFGNDEVAVLAVYEPSGVLSPAGLARLRAVTEAARSTDGIDDVVSLSDLEHVRVPEDAVIDPMEAPPMEVARVVTPGMTEDALLRRIRSDPTLTLLSDDAQTAVVLARMEGDIDPRRDAVLDGLRDRLTEAGEAPPMAGIGVVFSALNQASTRGIAVVVAGSYLVIVVLLAALFGRVGPVVVALGVVGVSATLAMGAYGAFGRDLNMVTMALPTLVLIIGVADCVHMLQRIADQPGGDVRAGVARVLWPCLFTSLTTAAGFAALLSARMRVVRDLGAFAAVAVLAAFVVTVIVVVAFSGSPAFQPRKRSGEWLGAALVRLGDAAMRGRTAVLGTAVVASLAGAWGISRIEADTYSIDYFYASHPVRQDSAFIEEHFGWYMPLEFVVEAPGGLRNAESMRAIAAWEDAMRGDPDVGWTRSIAGVVRRLNQVLTDGAAASYAVPPDDAALDQAVLTYESQGTDASDLVADPDWTRIRVTAGVRMMSAGDIGAAVERLEALAALPDGHRVHASGYLPLYVTMMDYVVRSQIWSFAVAFVAIFALLAALFRSLRMALLAVPGNLLPLLLTLGAMGVLGIRLDVATVTIAAIVLGLVVDDTTHFLYRYREVLRDTGDHEGAVREAMRTTGVAMVVTTVVLVSGFAVLGLAGVKSVAFFGLLAAFAMSAALLADLVVLPALLVTLRPKL